MTRVAPETAGFTLAEVCVAMLIIGVAAAGIAVMTSIAVRSANASGTQTMTIQLARQKLHELRALAWSVDTNGIAISDTTTDLSTQPHQAGGPGLQPSSLSLDSSLAGYADYLASDGAWLGTGSMPPPEAVYVRRWSISALPEDPANVLVLQVLVSPVIADRLAPRPRARLREDALLTTIMARRSP
jgi:prepilin-type N-terminal cleavage/methylation domain-containing protein